MSIIAMDIKKIFYLFFYIETRDNLPGKKFFSYGGVVVNLFFIFAYGGNLNIFRLIFWFYADSKFWSLDVYCFYGFTNYFA